MVTVFCRPFGLPFANTSCPDRGARSRLNASVGRWLASIFSSARSVSLSDPTTVASAARINLEHVSQDVVDCESHDADALGAVHDVGVGHDVPVGVDDHAGADAVLPHDDGGFAVPWFGGTERGDLDL
jgi:hypothetical protein